MAALIKIHFAVNDPNNGNFAHRVEAIQIDDGSGDTIELEPDRAFRFSDNGDCIGLHRRKFTYDRSKHWYGNWCWNAYAFTWTEGKRLLDTLRATRRWQCTTGEETFYHWFNEGLS